MYECVYLKGERHLQEWVSAPFFLSLPFLSRFSCEKGREKQCLMRRFILCFCFRRQWSRQWRAASAIHRGEYATSKERGWKGRGGGGDAFSTQTAFCFLFLFSRRGIAALTSSHASPTEESRPTLKGEALVTVTGSNQTNEEEKNPRGRKEVAIGFKRRLAR